MELRLALPHDLRPLQAMYREIVAHMDEIGVRIWDEVYPCALLEADIAHRRLYVLAQQGEPLSAFALCPSSAGADRVAWARPGERAFYLERLGVRVSRLRTGLGSLALDHAAARTDALGAGVLRLFAAECNGPAIHLYRKNGFRQAQGVYEEHIDGGLVLRELGFERDAGPVSRTP